MLNVFLLLVVIALCLCCSNSLSTSVRGSHLENVRSRKMEAVSALVADAPVVAQPKASIKASTINLMKNCVGAGVFSLSAKILTVSSISNPTLVPKATALITVLALWAMYNFFIITETCRISGASTYGDCWSENVSRDTRWIIEGIISFGPMIGCLSNTIVLTDLFSGIMQSLKFPHFIYSSRSAVAFLISSCIIYPLCSLPNLSALQGTSLLGLIGQIVAMLVVGVRVMDKSYLPGGFYAALTAVQNSAPAKALASPGIFQWFIFTSLLSYCYVTHYNAPKYFNEMEDNSPPKMIQMISGAYLGAAAFYAVSLWLGIKAFGAACKPYLLNNLSAQDPLSAVARLSIAASILASTPLMFMNVRNNLITIAKKRMPILGGLRPMTAFLVLGMGAMASKLTDISVIGSIAGGILGTNMMYTLPPVMYLRALQKQAHATGKKVSPLKSLMLGTMAACGAFVSAVGTYNSVKTLF